jgi:hypothetical protein
MMRLLVFPTEAGVLAPLVTRDIVDQLLAGDQGGRLWRLAVLGVGIQPITRVAAPLREDFDRPLRIEGLARDLIRS